MKFSKDVDSCYKCLATSYNDVFTNIVLFVNIIIVSLYYINDIVEYHKGIVNNLCNVEQK